MGLGIITNLNQLVISRREGLKKELTDWPCTDKILDLAVSVNRWEAVMEVIGSSEYKVYLKIFR